MARFCEKVSRRSLRTTKKGFYVVAEDAGRIVGGLMVTYEWSDWRNAWFWWIQSVYILPEARGQKIYSRLYDFVRSRAAEAGNVCGFRLYVETDNAHAQQVYKSVGMDASHYLMYEEKAMTKISEAEFARICHGINEDRESIIKHNPIGPPDEILLWMLLSCLISYLNLSEIETPCFNGKPDAKTYQDAILFVLEERGSGGFWPERILHKFFYLFSVFSGAAGVL